MVDIDLYAKIPFKHGLHEKVMGFDYNRGKRFICGAITYRNHQGKENAYTIESPYGNNHSGVLYENSILPSFDEKILSRELEKDKMLTISIICHNGTIVVVEKDNKEVFKVSMDESEYIESGELMKSYELLLTLLGYRPLLDEMYIGDSLMVLKFEKEDENKKED